MPIFKEMKKILFISTIILSLAFVSCHYINISNTEKDTSIAAPGITSTTDGLVIAPKYMSGASYMSIFRYEVNGATDTATIVENSTKLVGQITPAENYVGATQFVDFYTSSSDKYYQYYIRYKNSSSYVYSKTSGTIKGVGSSDLKSITKNTSTEKIQISYDESQSIISFASTDITLPTPVDTTDSFDLKVGLNNGVYTMLFPMTLDAANSKYTLSLRNVLPDNFYDKALIMVCLVGQTDEKSTVGTNDSTVSYTTYHWTSSLAAEALKDTTVIESFTITKDVADTGITDFTPSANKLNFTFYQPVLSE